jgi:hypothetical protein
LDDPWDVNPGRCPGLSIPGFQRFGSACISVNQRLKVFAKDRLTAVATIHHRITRARIFEPAAARQDEFFTATPDWWQW